MQYEQPLCDDSRDTSIVCGKLQVNGRSVTALKVCDCGPSRPACPMNFDPYDGQTGLLGAGDQLKASLSIKSYTKHLEWLHHVKEHEKPCSFEHVHWCMDNSVQGLILSASSFVEVNQSWKTVNTAMRVSLNWPWVTSKLFRRSTPGPMRRSEECNTTASAVRDTNCLGHTGKPQSLTKTWRQWR